DSGGCTVLPKLLNANVLGSVAQISSGAFVVNIDDLNILHGCVGGEPSVVLTGRVDVQRVFTCAAVDLVERGEGGCGLAIYADGQRIDDVIACRAVEGVGTGSQRNGLAGIV